MGTQDKASNKAQDIKGKAKEAAGKATGNDKLEEKGKTDQAKASVRDLGEKVKDTASSVKRAVTD